MKGNGIAPALRSFRAWGWVFWILAFFSPSVAEEELVLKETFDTASVGNRDIHDTRFADYQIRNGNIILFYSSFTNSPPVGLECTLPISAVEPDEREMDLSFGGGGIENSNSLFISYAVGSGHRFVLPPLPYGALANSWTGSRTGYVIRYLRHGDGTNEVKFYRSDTGWVKELKSEWLPSNPVMTLQRTVILHRKNGEHKITATFDTGVRFEKTFTFEDDAYPPNNAQRGIQVIAKSHAGVITTLQIRLDTWIVQERSVPGGLAPSGKKPAAKEKSKRKVDVSKELPRARDLYDTGDFPSAREACLGMLSSDNKNADVLDLLGLIESSSENYSDAHKYLSEALEIRKKRYGSENPKVGESLSHLAALYGATDPAEAERLYRSALSILEKSLGPENADIVPVLQGLAGLYATHDRPADAEALYKRSLGLLEKGRGSVHPDVARCLYELAGFYRNRNKFELAKLNYWRALSVWEKSLGPDHPDVIACLHNLEMIYASAGMEKVSEAEPIYRRLLESREKLLGPDHPEVAVSLNLLGAMCFSQGRAAEAETYFKRALEIREKALGLDHTYTATSLSNLAGLYYSTGRFADAEALLKRSLAVTEKALGPDDPHVAEILVNLAEVYRVQKKFAAAEQLYKRELEIKKKALGPEHLYVANSLNNLATFYYHLGRFADAERHFKQALAIKEKALGPDHEEVALILENFSVLYKKMDRLSESDAYMARAKKIKAKKGGGG